MRRLAIGCLLVAMSSQAAIAQELVIYGAGSLRESIGEIARAYGAAHGVAVRTEFGPSGRLRERIEKGERVDVFTSADLGHARKLVADGRASVMAMFARNTLCVLAPRRLSLTTQTVTDRLLDPSTKIGVSPPKIDPLGDYTVQLLDRIGAAHPGSRAGLDARSVVIDAPPGSPPARSGDINVDALRDGRTVLDIVYCSGRARYARLMPDGAMTALPPDLQVGPEYGLAVMRDAHPRAADLALAILSPEGQRVMANWGFVPVALPRE